MRSWRKTAGARAFRRNNWREQHDWAVRRYNETMAEQVGRVESYAGYKAEEGPLRIVFETQSLEIAELEDRWYSPGATYFRVLAGNGDRYVLRHDDAQDVWSLTAYRSADKRGRGQTR